MEIVDYLRAARRRLALIHSDPAGRGREAAALLFLQPQMYVATATVDPPALVGGPHLPQYTGAQGVIQFVAAFQATASGPVVRQQISEQTKVPAADLGDRLLVTQRGGSPSVAVTYTSTEKADVDKVVEAASTLTLRTMFTLPGGVGPGMARRGTGEPRKSANDAGARSPRSTRWPTRRRPEAPGDTA